ncbi:cyclase family protein [Actinomadura logoneensis]|uniref:Cyclase family protein n=1 Tax=Actinomadura logoneensis TaxID=2293572 RepID=A0A372JBM2_9ACTN|nr:cyclase family protein [Actinomadura logoneensis]RFU37411.1 cyclase family protein [Actinomadura logoneensis]
MTFVDLTHPVESGMPVYPGDPEVLAEPALTVPADGANVARLHLGSQSGTHVDAPFHIDDALPRLAELPLERFAGPVVLMDATGLAGREIGPGLLPDGLRPGAVLLVRTGWSRRWGSAEYWTSHPYLAAETAAAIIGAGVRTVGLDTASADPSGSLAAHRVLLGASAVICENLTGLERITGPAEVTLFPLRLEGAHAGDGAPVRAVARLLSA